MTARQKKLLDKMDSSRMLDIALDQSIVDLRSVKFVLNVLAGLKEPKHLDAVIANLDRLQPVSETVARFLSEASFADDVHRVQVGKRLLDHLQQSSVTEFQAIWLLQPFAQSARWDHPAALRSTARDSTSSLVRRQAALAVGHAADRSSLLDLKMKLGQTEGWEYRAILYACRSLPKDERDAFWRSLHISKDWSAQNGIVKATVELAKHCAP
jgi:hypothetical protein